MHMKLPVQFIYKNPEDHKSSAWNSRITVSLFHESKAANSITSPEMVNLRSQSTLKK